MDYSFSKENINMRKSSLKKPDVINLEPDSQATIVKGTTRLIFNATGGLNIYGHIAVTVHLPPAPPRELQVGDLMPSQSSFYDWYYGGVSLTDHKPMYIGPEDVGPPVDWDTAMEIARKATGWPTVRVPTESELDQLYVIAAKGEAVKLARTFNIKSRYWSSQSLSATTAQCQDFTSAHRTEVNKKEKLLLRLVR
jgi:hypothetical protein